MSEEAKQWSVEGYKEYCELCRRNFVLDNLWGDDELEPSADYVKWVNLDKIYGGGTNNGSLMIAAYEELKAERDEAKADGSTEALKLHNYNPEYIQGFVEERYFSGKKNEKCDGVLWEKDQTTILKQQEQITTLTAQLRTARDALKLFADWKPEGEIKSMVSSTDEVCFNRSTVLKAREALKEIGE